MDHGVGRGCPTQIFKKALKSAVSRLDSSPKLSRGVAQLNQVLIDAARLGTNYHCEVRHGKYNECPTRA